MIMKLEMIEDVAIRRNFSGLLGGCFVLTEYTNKILGHVEKLIFRLDSFYF